MPRASDGSARTDGSKLPDTQEVADDGRVRQEIHLLQDVAEKYRHRETKKKRQSPARSKFLRPACGESHQIFKVILSESQDQAQMQACVKTADWQIFRSELPDNGVRAYEQVEAWNVE